MNLEHRPDHAVNWPRAAQTSVAILGALTFGAIAYGYGYGVSSGRTESYPQQTDSVQTPMVQAWFTENWNYADSAEMHTDPNGWLSLGPGKTDEYNDLEIDSAAPWGAPYRNLKAGYDATGGGGYDITFPDASTDSLRTIWQEVWMKFTNGWKTDWGDAGNPDHKTLQWYDQGESGTRRTGFKLGVFGGGTQASLDANAFVGIQYCAGAEQGGVLGPNLPADVWDGNWQRFRFYISYDATPGADSTGVMHVNWSNETIGLGNDSTIVWCDAVGSGQYTSGFYINTTVMGRNQNHTPDSLVFAHYGKVTVYSTDPGWVFDTIN